MRLQRLSRNLAFSTEFSGSGHHFRPRILRVLGVVTDFNLVAQKVTSCFVGFARCCKCDGTSEFAPMRLSSHFVLIPKHIRIGQLAPKWVDYANCQRFVPKYSESSFVCYRRHAPDEGLSYYLPRPSSKESARAHSFPQTGPHGPHPIFSILSDPTVDRAIQCESGENKEKQGEENL